MLEVSRTKKSGFTLIELLVVVGITGVFVAMLFPAIQTARETARRMQCSDQLKQMATAFANHASAHGHYPTGGWHWRWTGDPDCGYGKGQPGGWIYNILPYIDQGSLRNLGSGLSYYGSGTNKKSLLTQLITTSLPMFHCPSRREAQLYPPKPDFADTIEESANTLKPDPLLVAKTDYAANAGDSPTIDETAGPVTMDASEVDHFSWSSTEPMTGVVFQRSTVTPAQITDGLGNTYCVGEKFLPSDYYENGYVNRVPWEGDNETAYSGYNLDHSRGTYDPPLFDIQKDRNHPVDEYRYRFGSAHPGGCNMAFCDGSVNSISYNVDLDVYRSLGCRDDAGKDPGPTKQKH